MHRAFAWPDGRSPA